MVAIHIYYNIVSFNFKNPLWLFKIFNFLLEIRFFTIQFLSLELLTLSVLLNWVGSLFIIKSLRRRNILKIKTDNLKCLKTVWRELVRTSTSRQSLELLFM